MTTPPDPFGQPPAYGQPPYGQPGYGQPPAYGEQPYGGAQLASWGSRVGALLLDVLLVVVLFVVVAIVAGVLGVVSDALGALVGVLGYIGAVGFFFWQLWVQGETGQTIGKKQLGIRLLREQDGRPVGGGLSIARYVVHIVDQLPLYVGYLWPLWDPKKQTFADKILNTVVVKV